jgi:ABC-type glycerol-3-phosphate transport system substrate-binding protein
MSKRILAIALIMVAAVAFSWSAPKKTLVHYHWTETAYDVINQNAAKAFMAKHPDVEVKMLFLPDGDRVNIIRTVLAANGTIDSFALNNGESAEFLGAGQMVPIIPAAFGKKSIDEIGRCGPPAPSTPAAASGTASTTASPSSCPTTWRGSTPPS